MEALGLQGRYHHTAEVIGRGNGEVEERSRVFCMTLEGPKP